MVINSVTEVEWQKLTCPNHVAPATGAGFGSAGCEGSR